MIHGKKVIVVMPAYNAEKTLEQTYAEIPRNIVDEVILTDDCSRDETVAKAYIIANGVYPVVFGSRILGKGALKGGMPLIKYIANISTRVWALSSKSGTWTILGIHLRHRKRYQCRNK